MRSVSDKYAACGWKIMIPPKGTINDLMAQNTAGKLHFIQIVQNNDTRTEGVPTGTFVQNALSNGARPVRAVIDRNGSVGQKITLIDADTNQKIVLRTKKIEIKTEIKTDAVKKPEVAKKLK